MKKISNDSAKALFNRELFSRSNTKVKLFNMFLFDNEIAKINSNNELEINNQGFCTQTTKNRLNAVLKVFGFNKYIVQRKGEWYWNDGLKFESNVWIVIK